MKFNPLPYAVCFTVGCFLGAIVYKSNPDNIKAACERLIQTPEKGGV